MRSCWRVAGALAGLVAVTSQCGGATSVATDDASVEGGNGEGGTPSSSGGSASSGTAGSSTAGSGGSNGGGSSSGSPSSSSGGSGSSGGSSSSSSGGPACPPCPLGQTCCSGQCENLNNNPEHCGTCATTCTGTNDYCGDGKCSAPPCLSGGPTCTNTQLCCGTECCTTGQICCLYQGAVDAPGCFTPTAMQPTCPAGCGGCTSDRNVKHDVEPVDPQSVLDGVTRLPIATWSCKSDDPSVRHMGMIAQDFYGEFGLGSTDKAFNPIDAHGVEMAAIQALYQRMQEQDARIRKLEAENAELRRTRHEDGP